VQRDHNERLYLKDPGVRNTKLGFVKGDLVMYSDLPLGWREEGIVGLVVGVYPATVYDPACCFIHWNNGARDYAQIRNLEKISSVE